MSLPSHSLFIALCAALPLVAVAQDQSPAPATKPAAVISLPQTAASQPTRSSHVSEDQAMQWFDLLDTNHDGCISREEAQVAIRFAPRLAKDFDAADTNHDGCITPDEIRALAERRRAEREARHAAQAQAARPGASAAAPAP